MQVKMSIIIICAYLILRIMYVISRDSTNKTRSLYCNSTAEKKKVKLKFPAMKCIFKTDPEQ